MIKSLAVFALSIFSMVALAKDLTMPHKSGTLITVEKEDWEMGKDMFGIPYMYFSPKKNGQRSNITFAATGADISFDTTNIAGGMRDYEKMKKEWAQKTESTVQGFIPYRFWSNLYGHKIHQVGFSYKNEEKIYVEHSFYIECKGKMYFSKSLRLEENKVHEKEFEDLIKHIDCGEGV